MTFDLTRTERLILSNQYEIQASLDDDRAAEHRQTAEHLRRGYSLLYTTTFEDEVW